jgi:hypothetical protein
MGRIIMDLSHLLWIIPSIIVIYHGLSWIIIFETTSHHLRMFALPTSFARAQHCTFWSPGAVTSGWTEGFQSMSGDWLCSLNHVLYIHSN